MFVIFSKQEDFNNLKRSDSVMWEVEGVEYINTRRPDTCGFPVPLSDEDYGRIKLENAPLFATAEEMRVASYNYCASGDWFTSDLEDEFKKIFEVSNALVFNFGRTAINTAFMALAAGGHIVAPKSIFGGTYTFLATMCPKLGGFVTFLEDINNLEELQNALKPETKLVFFDTISNPLCIVADLQEIVKVIKNYNSEILIVVDDTTTLGATTHAGKLFTPLTFPGVDLTVASLTKYACGFNNCHGGVVMIQNSELAGKVKNWRNFNGGLMDSRTAWLYYGSIEESKLKYRYKLASENALYFVDSLKTIGLDGIKILYPTDYFENLKKLDIATYGGIVGVDVGNWQLAVRIAEGIGKGLQNSFGGKETHILPEYGVWPESIHPILRELGFPEGLIRFSLGWKTEKEEIDKYREKIKEVYHVGARG